MSKKDLIQMTNIMSSILGIISSGFGFAFASNLLSKTENIWIRLLSASLLTLSGFIFVYFIKQMYNLVKRARIENRND